MSRDTVKVVAYDADGKAVAEKELHTAGKPDHIELVADRNVTKRMEKIYLL